MHHSINYFSWTNVKTVDRLPFHLKEKDPGQAKERKPWVLNTGLTVGTPASYPISTISPFVIWLLVSAPDNSGDISSHRLGEHFSPFWSSRLNYFQGSLIKINRLRGPCQQIHPSTRLQASEVHRLCVVPETCLSLVSWPWNSGWQCCPHPSPCPVLRNLSPASYTWRLLA